MINSELLEVACGMGFDASIKSNKKMRSPEYVCCGLRKHFRPTSGELIIWLMEKGNLELYDIVEVSYSIPATEHWKLPTNYHSQSESNLKENLLSVVLQVVRAENSK